MLALSGLAYEAEDDVRLSSPDMGVAIGRSVGDCIVDEPPRDIPPSPSIPCTFRNAEKLWMILGVLLCGGLTRPLR